MSEPGTFSHRRRKPRWGTLVLIALAHVAVLFGLARAFAPGFTASVIDEATSLVTVTVRTPPPPEPEPSPDSAEVEEGAAAEEGRRATPREVTAPEVPRLRETAAPAAASTGRSNVSGARDEGAGTGAGGEGEGTGAGRGGSGQGGIPVTGPVKIAGDINDARDYPTPPGGREVRRGHSVTIAMTVTVGGRATNCRVVEPSPDPQADRITCRLAEERFRFRPATDADGNPVPATYGWRQRWF